MDPKVDGLAADGVEAAINSSTVGIVSGSGPSLFTGLGTGSLIRWQGRNLILTAAHVIRETNHEDYRFFLPLGPPRTAGRDEILTMAGVPDRQLLPFSELALGTIAVDKALDLAAMEVDERLDGRHPAAQFADLALGGTTPDQGHVIIGKGFPRDLSRRTHKNEVVVFQYLEWTEVVPNRDGLEAFEAALHFLAPFGQTEPKAHPLGLSGSAMWFRRGLTPSVWHPNIDIAGVTLAYYNGPRLLKIVRREIVERFLTAHWP